MTASVTIIAQVLAEKEAWRLAEQHRLDLVAVCPNFIQGPALSPTLSGTSIGHLKVRSKAHNGPSCHPGVNTSHTLHALVQAHHCA